MSEVVNLSGADESVAATNALLGKMYSQLVAPPGIQPASDDPTVFAWTTPSHPVPLDIFDYLDGFIPTGRDLDVKAIVQSIEDQGIPRDDPKFQIAMAEAMQEERVAEVEERWAHAAEVAQLCDGTPNLDIVFGDNNDQTLMTLNDNTGPMSAAYRQILDELEIADRSPDPEDKKRLEAIEALLFEPEADPPGASAEGEDADPFGSMLSDLLGGETGEVTTARDLPRSSKMVRIYDEYQARYEAAIAQFAQRAREAQTSAQAANDFNRFGAIYRNQVESALRSWRSVGKKNEIEALQSMMSHLTRADMVTFVENARLRYDTDQSAARGQQEPFKFTSVVPGSIMELPWETVTFEFSDVEHHAKQTKTKGGGRFGVNFGFWAAGGGGDVTKETVDTSFDMKKLRLSFQIAQVKIGRPWFTPSLFESREWRLPGGQLLSDGKAVPSGRLRGYTDAMILVQGLTVQHEDLSRFYELEKKAAGGKGGLRIGPFKIGGGGSSSSTTVDSGTTRSETEFQMDGVAVAGFRCRRLPLLPNPDPTVTSWI